MVDVEALVKEYKYKKLPLELSRQVRRDYVENLDDVWVFERDPQTLKTKLGMPFAKSHSRVVIGDYGAFVEIKAEQMILENVRVKPGQEFRIDDYRFKDNVKYHWLTALDDSNIKIYLQQKTVPYADYRVGFYYVDPKEVML